MAGTLQYHEPIDKLDEETIDLARIFASLIEEADAINWYQQRIKASSNKEVIGILSHAQEEEFEHFAIDLEYLIRKIPRWKDVLEGILFKEGDILENAEKVEDQLGI